MTGLITYDLGHSKSLSFIGKSIDGSALLFDAAITTQHSTYTMLAEYRISTLLQAEFPGHSTQLASLATPLMYIPTHVQMHTLCTYSALLTISCKHKQFWEIL